MNFIILVTSLTLASLCRLVQPHHTHKHHFNLSPQPSPSTSKHTNAIDSCWRSDPDWGSNRFALADCAKGFGSDARGGKTGKLYTVVDPSDDPANPKPGTLRFGAIQEGPVWIIFQKDMVITLKEQLYVGIEKTIDGRGAEVHIADGPCLKVEEVEHVIIHGIFIHGCKASRPGHVARYAGQEPEEEGESDGDGITVKHSRHVWIDHCNLSNAIDGLIDVTHASTFVTISNNYFTQHDKVMLLGHSDSNKEDEVMKVTIIYNHFGRGLVQRMPRVRFGYAHVANNVYDQWEKYAIGGSANPTILSEGNYFVASEEHKEITWREDEYEVTEWKQWEWKSSKDVFINKAYFVGSGDGKIPTPYYTSSQSFDVEDGSLAPLLTQDAGPLRCSLDQPC